MEAIDEAALGADCSTIMLLSAHMRNDAHAYFKAMGYDGEAKRGFVKFRNEIKAGSKKTLSREI